MRSHGRFFSAAVLRYGLKAPPNVRHFAESQASLNTINIECKRLTNGARNANPIAAGSKES
jgi:hypothetical protein